MRLPSRLPIVLRQLVSASSLLLLALLASCGGGTDTPAPPTAPGPGPTPPPPPPPPPAPTVGPPHVVAVRAGDGQTADPGTTLAIAPSVVVRDSAGRPVPNVVVVFRVDSGGGVITGDTDTTTSDGVATLGTWTLGTREGPQSARVSVGSLPPLQLRAEARFSEVLLPPQSIDHGDGTVVWRRPGLPLDGLRLRTFPEAVGSATAVTLRVSSVQPFTVPAGLVSIGPAMQVELVGGEQRGPLVLTIPTTLPLDAPLFAAAFDDLTGAMRVLPLLSRTPDAISVALPTAAGLRFPVPEAAGSPAVHHAPWPRGSSPANTASPSRISLFLAIDAALLAGDFVSGFLPGRDHWQHLPLDVYGANAATGGGFATIFPKVSPSVSAVWHFLNKRTEAPLATRFHEAPGVPTSARMGYRWTAWLEERLPTLYRAQALLGSLEEFIAEEPTATLSHLMAIKAMMLLSRNAPQPVVIFEEGRSTADAGGFVGVAYRTVGNAVDVALPHAAPPFGESGSFRMEMGPTGWKPAAIVYGPDRTPIRVTAIIPLPAGGGFLDALMSETFPQVVAGTFGDADGWPVGTLMSTFGALDPADVVLLDRLVHWWECDACAATGFRTPLLDPAPPRLVAFEPSDLQPDGRWLNREALSAARALDYTSLGQRPTLTSAFGLMQPGADAGPSAVGEAAWFDFQKVRYRRMPTTVAPAEQVEASKDTSISFAVSASDPPSGQLRYRWTVRAEDGTGGDSIDTNTPSWTKEFSLGTDRYVVATVLHGDRKRPIGRDSVRVVVKPERLAWRLTSFAITGGDPLGDGGLGSIVPDAAHEWVLFVFLEPSAESGGAPVPGAYLQRILPGQPVVFSRTDPSVIALANRERDAQRNVAGVFTWTGTGSSGSVEGSGSPGRFSCGPFPFEGTRQFFRTIRANKTGATLGGVMSSRIDRTSGCAGGASLDMMTANFVARRVP